MSIWGITQSRQSLLDLTPALPVQRGLVLTPQLPSLDTGLFIRPYRKDAWIGIIVTTLILILTIIVVYIFTYNQRESNAMM
jgi:hypothetical protein